jgi:transcriptional regulator with XRE-family HTH domain
MTTWQEFKREYPLSGEAEAAYEAERRRMGVGYLILKARASAELTQSELAEKLGTSQPTIARWEGGAQVPSVRSLLRIAEATGFELELGLRQGDRVRHRLTLET